MRVGDERRREEQVVAALAVGGARAREDQEAAIPAPSLDALGDPEPAREGSAGSSIRPKHQTPEKSQAAHLENVRVRRERIESGAQGPLHRAHALLELLLAQSR